MNLTQPTRRFIILWLGLCSGLIFCMVLLGGAVRLTGSGLSMVNWQPLLGVLPPVTESAWTQVFEAYQQYPEFKLINTQMTLENFKFIYMMEYAHRSMGRIIGLVFFLPFIYLILTKRLNRRLTAKLWILFALGTIQGGVGWYMVKSGLVDNPRVDQYRLVLHLIIAVVIYTYMVRLLVGLSAGSSFSPPVAQKLGSWVVGILFLMIVSGGFVAGTHAGFIYNTFPTMGGEWMPAEMTALAPFWRNIFENPTMIQFIHRVLAVVVLTLVARYAFLLWSDRQNTNAKLIGLIMIIAVIVQINLGISTLLWQVPIVLGVAHQAGALILLTSVVFAASMGRALLDNPKTNH